MLSSIFKRSGEFDQSKITHDPSRTFLFMGSPRSGTTLLIRTLNISKDIIVPGESDFIAPLALLMSKIEDEKIGKELTKKFIINNRKFINTIGVYLSPGEIEYIIEKAAYSPQSIVSGIFSTIANKTNSKIAGDKSPNDLQLVQFLGGFLNGKTKILHLVRDVRALTLSLIKAGWIEGIEEYFPRTWSSSNLYLHNKLKGEKFYHLVKYEDLVREPEKELKDICKFLGAEFDPNMLDHKVREGFDDPNHENLTKPFLPGKATEWKKNIDPKLKKLIDQQAKEAIDVFYP